jgi:hypothetical protein
MSRQNSDSSNDSIQRQRALSRWDNEGGAGPDGPAMGPALDKEQIPIPEMSNADGGAACPSLRVGEPNDFAACHSSNQQLELAHEMAAYISPRPGFTHHPLTTHAAAHMIGLVERLSRFRQL